MDPTTEPGLASHPAPRPEALDAWAASLAIAGNESESSSIGLVSCSPHPNDRRVVDRLSAAACRELQSQSTARSLLVIRLDVFFSRDTDRQLSQPAGIPKAVHSPLGPWQDITIPMPVGNTASWSLLQIPRWISTWRKCHNLILIDLGPIHLVPSRIVGRLCRSNFMLLGPNACPSTAWIGRHVGWHAECGSRIVGTLVSKLDERASVDEADANSSTLRRAA